MILISILVENCLKYDAIHDFLVWLITSSNPTDIYRLIEATLEVLLKIFETIRHNKTLIIPG